ncbi:hypothetical protein BIU88_04060 [Chlorobaculum limnaeum]|uniref:DUF4347 domain-containing protein n=1 Tax=Chlorobaculum limnaeum TaxID=274537 RepID=A0A1D8D5X0_CHLLM|nr:DUF4347 domain-containing protein [Chlorobaculum limnaeum]AOS83388.1 hypothetical protein BIU88_04060 [Chlorobaculum limnaeum]
MSTTLFFIDSRVADKDLLIAQFSTDTDYLVLDSCRDGLDQMAEYLSGRTGYDSIQIISHGSPGSIIIGSTVLDNGTLTAYADQLAAIERSLTDDGDLQLYGCNVGQGDAGGQFVSTLAELTGADVAASDDVTGSSVLGGDWELEIHTGVIETAPAWSSEPAISGTLSTFSDDENYDLATFAQLAKLSRLAYETGGELNNQLQWIGWSLHSEARYDAFDAGAIYINAHAICAVRNEDGKKEMTIAFQGSDLIDFVTTDIAGYGFSLYYRSVRAEVVAWLKEAVAQEYDAIYITGHSLGGAAAQIALLDIMGNQNQSIWTLSTVPLNTNDRITDAGLTSEELSYVRSHISGATFGAPDVRWDPFKPSLIYDELAHLNDNVYDESWFKTHLYQFEHKSTGIDGDPVAALGDEIGQFVAIDLSEDIKDRYWGLNPIAFLHSMDAYNESMLRASTGSPLISSGSLLYGELIDSLSTNPGEGNDRIVLTQAKFNAQPLNDRLNASAGNDILITNSTTPQSALVIGGDGHDTYIVHDSGVDIKISGPSGEHIDNLYFNQIGQISTYVNEDNLVVLISNYDESSRVEIIGWYSSEETYRIGQIGVIQPSDDFYWSFRNISLESLNIPLFREGLDYSDDVIVGLYAEDDIMNGYGGNDTMEGRGGNDEINPGLDSDWVDAGSGDDTVNVVAVGWYSQSDTLDGGSGSDILNLDYSDERYNSWGYDYAAWFHYGIYDAEDTRTTLTNGSSLNEIQAALGSSVKVMFDGYNTDVVASNFEEINLKGSQTDNLLICQMVGSYDGQGGTDTFYADWSGKSTAVNWTNIGEAYTYEGFTVSNVERLLLQTGSGSDVIDNTAYGTNDDVRTGAGDDAISLGWGNDYIDGESGMDTMDGGFGNDTYVVDNAGDVVKEAADGGADTIESSITYTLGTCFENLTLTGTKSINGTGNVLDNILTGNSGSNILNGGYGIDTMDGGFGNDTYVVDNAGDVVEESFGAGTDTVRSIISYILGSNVENLMLTGSNAINGTGNSLNNIITGNGADNVLDGGTGADMMVGGQGNDVYVVDNTGDVVKELAGAGTDIVRSGISYTLGTNIENLTLKGSDAINGKGNVLNNVINGNDAANVLNGATGNDTIFGGGGNDTITGGLGIDEMSGGEGNDLFIFDYLATSESGIVTTSRDIITDFVTGHDRLELSAIDANVRVANNQTFDSMILLGQMHFTAAGQLCFDSATGMLYGNTDNNVLTAELSIQLIGVTSLAPDDISL